MKKRLLSLVIASMLSIVMLYGCGDKDNSQNNTPSPSQSQSQNDSNKDTSNEEVNVNSIEGEGTNGETTVNENIETKIKDKFTEAIATIYNTDYNSVDKVKEVTDYIESNFTKESKEDMLNVIQNYSSKISSSDLVITLVKEVENIDDSKYDGTYEIRYSVTITEEKPFVYTDIIGKVVIDKSGNVLINSINEGNF